MPQSLSACMTEGSIISIMSSQTIASCSLSLSLQLALMENYQKLDSLLKGLRRQLPFTHTTVDWDKIINAKIVREMDLAQSL